MNIATSADQASTRSALYALFAFLFSYPDADWVAAIRAGEVAERMQSLCAALTDALELTQADHAALSDAGPANDADKADNSDNADHADHALAIEYTRLFDTGPIALYGGLNHGTRMQVMEEVLRFYEHFGLAPNRQRNDLPDHLVAELEFMHFLCHQEAAALQAGKNALAENYQRGQRDFLQRQLGRWAPQLHSRLQTHKPLPFFTTTTHLLSKFLHSEMQ